MENNIFKYAPNELVQDAFICWLLNWINTKNDEENIKEVAKSILEKIIEDYKGKKQTINYSNFKIIPQYPIKLDNYKIYDENSKQVFKKKKEIKEKNGRIDILVVVDKYAIIIEDKVNTNEHDFQIYQYKKALQNKIKELEELNKKQQLTEEEKALLGKEVVACYYKIFDECNMEKEKYKEDKKYIDSLINRGEILKILPKNKIKNLYYNQYIEYLEEIEKVSKSLVKNKKISVNNTWLRTNTIMDLQYLGLLKHIQKCVEDRNDIFPKQKVYWGKANESGAGDTWWCNIETEVEVEKSTNFRERAFLKINAYENYIKIRLMIGKKAFEVKENKNRAGEIRYIYEFNNNKYIDNNENCIEIKYQIKNKAYNEDKKKIYKRLEDEGKIEQIQKAIDYCLKTEGETSKKQKDSYKVKEGGNSGNYEITVFTIITELNKDSDKVLEKLQKLLQAIAQNIKNIKITELKEL